MLPEEEWQTIARAGTTLGAVRAYRKAKGVDILEAGNVVSAWIRANCYSTEEQLHCRRCERIKEILAAYDRFPIIEDPGMWPHSGRRMAPDWRGPDLEYWEGEPCARKGDKAILAVEVRAPNETHSRIYARVCQHLKVGVPMVWVVDPEDRSVRVYRSPLAGRLLHEEASLTGEDVLPGFSCRVAEIFA